MPRDPESILESIQKHAKVPRSVAIEWLRQANARDEKSVRDLDISKENLTSFIDEQYGFKGSVLPQFMLGAAKPAAEYGGGLISTLAGLVDEEAGQAIGEKTYGAVEKAQGQYPEAPVSGILGEFAGFPLPGEAMVRGGEAVVGPLLSRLLKVSTPMGRTPLSVFEKAVGRGPVAPEALEAALPAMQTRQALNPILGGAVGQAVGEGVAPGRSGEDVIFGGLFGGAFGAADGVMRGAMSRPLAEVLHNPKVANAVRYLARLQHRTVDEMVAGLQTFGALDGVLKKMPGAPKVDVTDVMTADDANLLKSTTGAEKQSLGHFFGEDEVAPPMGSEEILPGMERPGGEPSFIDSLTQTQAREARADLPTPPGLLPKPKKAKVKPSDLRLTDLLDRAGRDVNLERDTPWKPVGPTLRDLISAAEREAPPGDPIAGMQQTGARIEAAKAVMKDAADNGASAIPKKVVKRVEEKPGKLIPLPVAGAGDEAERLLYRLEQEFWTPKKLRGDTPVSKERTDAAIQLRKELGYAPLGTGKHQTGVPAVVHGRRFSYEGSPDLFYADIPAPEFGDKLILKKLEFKNPLVIASDKEHLWGDLIPPELQQGAEEAIRAAKPRNIADVLSNPQLLAVYDEIDAMAIQEAVRRGHDGIIRSKSGPVGLNEYIDLHALSETPTPGPIRSLAEVRSRLKQYDMEMAVLAKENEVIMRELKGGFNGVVERIKKGCK